jgi:hypothetical protein
MRETRLQVCVVMQIPVNIKYRRFWNGFILSVALLGKIIQFKSTDERSWNGIFTLVLIELEAPFGLK